MDDIDEADREWYDAARSAMGVTVAQLTLPLDDDLFAMLPPLRQPSLAELLLIQIARNTNRAMDRGSIIAVRAGEDSRGSDGSGASQPENPNSGGG